MSPHDRRIALLDVGLQIFSTAPFESLSMTDIAEAAGVTRRLLYHYFPTKAEFFGAVWARAHQDLAAASASVHADTVRDHIEQTLAGYLEFYAAHLPLALIANRSSISADQSVRRPIDEHMSRLWATYLDVTGATGATRSRAETGFAGWIAFVRATTTATLLDEQISPADNHQLCMSVLDAAVGAHIDLSTAMPQAQF